MWRVSAARLAAVHVRVPCEGADVKRERLELVRIMAPHFVAGVLVDDNMRVAVAAPILRWAVHRPIDWLASYCRGKGWGIEAVP